MTAPEWSKGLEGVVATDTKISLVDGQNGRLIYRGYDAKELSLAYTFEEVCFLLWNGHLPDQNELAELSQQFRKGRELPEHTRKILKELPQDMSMMGVIRTCLSSLENTFFSWPPTIEQAVAATSTVPVIIASRMAYLAGKEPLKSDDSLDHVANYLYLIHEKQPSETQIKALTVYCILTMEHGMNASTFASRVIASTESDLISSVAGAIGAMKGPLHGGAPSEVTHMLNDIGSKERAEAWITAKLENKEKLMGFGHRVYKTTDPRSEALKEMTKQLAGENSWLDLAYHVEEIALRLLDYYKPGRRLYTNVEFYAAAILKAVELPSELFTPTFTASRMVGWTANIIEQSQDNRIFRPQSIYTGSVPENKEKPASRL
ncbi:citrate synthase/methylcitrate synthase [Jeotgalibacillus proteolyticus]|uniref:Citrate synthase n=1 Tax=Jeotgalibacillus proteolyticus TaxID=2082395 RepID=A0A2S5GDD9_9BACL|nr:citrate synthase/methylcitrate synthase [Jeotgalibacillus proteolyticus]PPA70924.1 citrate synthase/methylcitrate synthase [Jeotgalibacillus proteolyticus]